MRRFARARIRRSDCASYSSTGASYRGPDSNVTGTMQRKRESRAPAAPMKCVGQVNRKWDFLHSSAVVRRRAHAIVLTERQERRASAIAENGPSCDSGAMRGKQSTWRITSLPHLQAALPSSASFGTRSATMPQRLHPRHPKPYSAPIEEMPALPAEKRGDVREWR